LRANSVANSSTNFHWYSNYTTNPEPEPNADDATNTEPKPDAHHNAFSKSDSIACATNTDADSLAVPDANCATNSFTIPNAYHTTFPVSIPFTNDRSPHSDANSATEPKPEPNADAATKPKPKSHANSAAFACA
jgi:hypothetical protein